MQTTNQIIRRDTWKYPWARKIVRSRYMDIFGAVLIFIVCIQLKFHQTIFQAGEIKFGIPNADLFKKFMDGAFPLGILSTIGAIFSLLSTRLVGKQNNIGNVIGVITTVNSGAIDYMFGNASAIITYPITFFIHSYAVRRWSRGETIRDRDTYYYIINILGLILAYILVFLGAKLFGGRIDLIFLHVVAITFGLSLGANICNAFKYEETWFSWVIYNFIQLLKAILQLNIANIAKYIFYLVNAFITLVDWKYNRDIKNQHTLEPL